MLVKDIDHLHLHAEDCFAEAARLREAYGFAVAARTAPDAEERAVLLVQGRIRLLISSQPTGSEGDFVLRHGTGVADVALAVHDVVGTFEMLLARGAEPVGAPERLPGGTVARIRAFGDVVHSLVERDDPDSLLPPTRYALEPTGDPGPAEPLLDAVDHLAVCLPHGALSKAVDHYRDALGFEVAYEEYVTVGGQAMDSKVVQDPAGHVVLTLLEPDPLREPGQIDRFLRDHGDAGVQHIAFRTDDIARAADGLRDRGVAFLTTPATYYETLEERVGPLHPPLDVAALRARSLLADQDRWGRLFQIFTRSTHPRHTLFFELIQRDRARTFGSGNIRALYEAVRRSEAGDGPVAHGAGPDRSRAVPQEARPIRVRDYELLARDRLPHVIRDFIGGGSGEEVTLRENAEALGRLRLRPNVLRGVGAPDTSTTVLGDVLATPVAVAPVAYHTLVHPEGEVATARAAADAGALTVVSTFSGRSLEETAQSADGPLWLQVYCFRDRQVTEALVRRAQRAGYRALVLTVDTPVLGRRYRDLRNGFALPPGIRPGNFAAGAHPDLGSSATGRSAVAQHAIDTLEPALTWADIAWLRRLTDLPIVLKGVLAPEDARRAVAEGVDAVVVSNHGGRQLDTTAAAIDLLPGVAEAVGERCEVLFDGGVRDGTGVLKALALGARAVLVGRPVLWSLSVDGRRGVRHLLDLYRAELSDAMALCGRATLAELDPSLVLGATPGCGHAVQSLPVPRGAAL